MDSSRDYVRLKALEPLRIVLDRGTGFSVANNYIAHCEQTLWTKAGDIDDIKLYSYSCKVCGLTANFFKDRETVLSSHEIIYELDKP